MNDRFIEACGMGDISAFEDMLPHVKNIDALHSIDRWSALHVASYRGHLEIVKRLLLAGADIDLVCPYGKPAIGYAIFNGQEEVIDFLLSERAEAESSSGFLQLPDSGDDPEIYNGVIVEAFQNIVFGDDDRQDKTLRIAARMLDVTSVDYECIPSWVLSKMIAKIQDLISTCRSLRQVRGSGETSSTSDIV